LQTFIGKSESLAQRASLSLQVHKKDKEIQEINIFFDWIEYIRVRGGESKCDHKIFEQPITE
jgi:hypothetical protein